MRWVNVIAVAIVLAAGEAPAAEPDAAALASLIDRHIDARLQAEKIRPASDASDAEFLRRVYLDLHGVIPTAEQAGHFLADTDPAKRAKLIDALLASPRYGEHLGDIWQGYMVSPLADDQRLRSDRFGAWMAEQFNTRTWDKIAADLLTATGKMEDNPAVTYLIEGRLPRTVPDLTDLTSRYFLGLRLNCAQCHDHPFVKWKQQEFWGMAAFFTQIQTPGRSKLVYQVGVKDYPEITLTTLQETGMVDGFQSRPPTFLGGEEMKPGRETNRAALAAWITSPRNPYFAKAMVNRTWWRLFGRGIVQPVDDMHEANPPSHPELLEDLSQRFIESGFDLKHLTRAIVLSRAYQRTSRPGEAPDKEASLFGRMSIKALSPGQLYDSLTTILGPPARMPGLDARQTPRSEFVQFFADDGDPDPTSYRRGIPHLLRQMNSAQFGRSLHAFATRTVKPGSSADELSKELFLTILSRRPTNDEQRLFRDHGARCDSTMMAYRELAWALLLTSEFSLNH